MIYKWYESIETWYICTYHVNVFTNIISCTHDIILMNMYAWYVSCIWRCISCQHDLESGCLDINLFSCVHELFVSCELKIGSCLHDCNGKWFVVVSVRTEEWVQPLLYLSISKSCQLSSTHSPLFMDEIFLTDLRTSKKKFDPHSLLHWFHRVYS